MKREDRVNMTGKFKPGDIVRFKEPKTDSGNSGYFKPGYTNLEIEKVNKDDYSVYDSNKSCIWYVGEWELELDTPVNQVTKGTFMWAVEQMKEGRKVKRVDWDNPVFMGDLKVYYSSEPDRYIENPIGTVWAGLSLEDYEATDWEVLEENVFGDFECKEGWIYDNKFNKRISTRDIYNLEKAIKRARELIDG